MHNQIKNTPLDTFIGNYGTENIYRNLKDNEYRESKIKIKNFPEYIYGVHSSTISIFAYITAQAASKVLPKPLNFVQVTISGEGYVDELKRQISYIYNSQMSEFNNVFIIHLAESNFYKNKLFNYLNDIGISNKQVNTEINKMIPSLFGLAVNKDKKDLYIFKNKDKRLETIDQIFINYLAFKFLNKETNIEKVHTLFSKLINIYRLSELETDNSRKKNLIWETIIEYTKDLPEYTIDKTFELEKIIKVITRKKLENYTYQIDEEKRQIAMLLENIARHQRTLDDYLLQYNGVKNQLEASDGIKQNIQDMIDLLNRSKTIKNYGFLETKVWFEIFCPLKINNKEEWERISPNVIENATIRTLVNKTFVDEEYELYTECTPYFNINGYDVGRYKNQDRTNSNNAIPHPHISGYNCFGQHSTVIAKCITKNDFVSTIEQIIEAASGMNYADGPVTNKFARYLINAPNIKCFRDPKTDEWFSINDYTERIAQNETSQTDSSDTNN